MVMQPTWTEDEVAGIWRDLLINWMLDAKNQQRENVCKAAKVDALLSTPYLSVVGRVCYEMVSCPRAEAHSTCLFGEGNEERETSPLDVIDAGEKANGNEGEATGEQIKPTSNIVTRVKQKTYERKRKPRLHQQTPYIASHLRPRKKI